MLRCCWEVLSRSHELPCGYTRLLQFRLLLALVVSAVAVCQGFFGTDTSLCGILAGAAVAYYASRAHLSFTVRCDTRLLKASVDIDSCDVPPSKLDEYEKRSKASLVAQFCAATLYVVCLLTIATEAAHVLMQRDATPPPTGDSSNRSSSETNAEASRNSNSSVLSATRCVLMVVAAVEYLLRWLLASHQRCVAVVHCGGGGSGGSAEATLLAGRMPLYHVARSMCRVDSTSHHGHHSSSSWAAELGSWKVHVGSGCGKGVKAICAYVWQQATRVWIALIRPMLAQGATHLSRDSRGVLMVCAVTPVAISCFLWAVSACFIEIAAEDSDEVVGGLNDIAMDALLALLVVVWQVYVTWYYLQPVSMLLAMSDPVMLSRHLRDEIRLLERELMLIPGVLMVVGWRAVTLSGCDQEDVADVCQVAAAVRVRLATAVGDSGAAEEHPTSSSYRKVVWQIRRCCVLGQQTGTMGSGMIARLFVELL